jgi:hypothetical protein
MIKYNKRKLKKVFIHLPFNIGGAEWEPDVKEREAAWSLFVELVTRVAIQPLHPEQEQGLLREALISLHSLFATTREILKAAGPDIGASRHSVGGIAIIVLNQGLRPFLSKWHPLLQIWEAQRPINVSLKQHEQNWTQQAQLRSDLELLRQDLEQYAVALSVISGIDYYYKNE